MTSKQSILRKTEGLYQGSKGQMTSHLSTKLPPEILRTVLKFCPTSVKLVAREIPFFATELEDFRYWRVKIYYENVTEYSCNGDKCRRQKATYAQSGLGIHCRACFGYLDEEDTDVNPVGITDYFSDA